MKFLCDRCKTRYSIGDERVRGKILKIRCKNCANVITVREGMPDADAAPAQGAGVARRTQTTTAAPAIQSEAPASAHNGGNKNALGAAFASAMSKPPPALDEEWYVSIDGDQSGPYSLAEAQRWVSGQPFDAELHCWSEGFDDWLPVDKVSHFRGLRKKPAPPAMPPPVPRGGSGPVRAITAQAPRSMAMASLPAKPPIVEDEPKPLFAATMASLEKSAPTAISSGGGMAALRIDPLARATVPAATPVAKPAPYVNGITARGPALPAAKPAVTTRGVGLASSAAPAFDPSATAVESPAFVDEQPPAAGQQSWPQPKGHPLATAEPIAAPFQRMKSEPHLRSVDKQTGPNDAFLDSMATARDDKRAPALSLEALASAKSDEDKPEVDELDIGEVSRVVKLADIMAQPRSRSNSTGPAAAKRTGSIGRVSGAAAVINRTASVPKINGATAPVALIDAVDAVPAGNVVPALPVVEPPAASRRGLIVLIICALLLVGAAGIVVVKMLQTPDDVSGLGGEYEYNGQRPDDPLVKRGANEGPGSAEPPPNPFIPRPPRPPRPPTQGSARVDLPAGNTLRSDEVEAMARTTSGTTTACFRRADKGADAIRLADVKKIRVSFKVNPDGSIAPGSVDLSEKGSTVLTACIQRMISGWKFRPNAGGDFGFVFAKPD